MPSGRLSSAVHSCQATLSGTATSTEHWIGSRPERWARPAASRASSSVVSAAVRAASTPDRNPLRASVRAALRRILDTAEDGLASAVVGFAARPLVFAARLVVLAARLVVLAACFGLLAARLGDFAGLVAAIGSAERSPDLLGLVADGPDLAGKPGELPPGLADLLGDTGEVDLRGVRDRDSEHLPPALKGLTAEQRSAGDTERGRHDGHRDPGHGVGDTLTVRIRGGLTSPP
jgi:hypothetical protein